MAVIKRILPFMQSPKFPELSKSLAVLMMGKNKGIKETQYHNSILKALYEDSSDQVV